MTILFTILAIMLFCLFVEVPMIVGMFLSGFAAILIFFPTMSPLIIIQQFVAGVDSFTYLAIPMFILAAEIMCSGTSANRLLRFIRSLIGHICGGVAITTVGTCTLFGAISGSAQATLVAVGKPMWGELHKMGYSDHHCIGLTVNSATIAVLIPPSILMILYAVSTGCSVADLFICGIIPGLLLFVFYSIYEYFYAKKQGAVIIRDRRASGREVWDSFKQAILPLGFPLIILGGIYTGICTPTEAAAVSVFYAFIIECFCLRTLKFKGLCKAIMSTGVTCGSIFALCAAGMVMSWVVTYANIPQALAGAIINENTTITHFLLITSIFMLITCMFMDNIPAIVVMTPILWPIAESMGVPVLQLGVIITIEAAIGAVTPPFGCNIFTACAIYDKSYTEVVKGVIVYMLIALALAMLLVFVPEIATFLVD